MFYPFFSDIFKEGIWKETADFTDPCLQGLASRLQKSYQRGRHLLLALINLKGNYLPANPIHVAVYLQHVLESTKSYSSVDSAFYAIKWAHEIAGMASPTDNQVVSRVREAAMRILGAGRPNRKESLEQETIRSLVC